MKPNPNEIVKELTNMVVEYALIDVCNPKRIETLTQAANLIQSLTPRPIEETPKNSYVLVKSAKARRGVSVAWWNDSQNIWSREDGNLTRTDKEHQPKTFIPLSAIQALMGDGV